MKKTFNEISIADYYRIKDICEDEAMEAMDKDVAVIAILEGVDEEVIWNLPVPEFAVKKANLGFLSDTNFDTNWKADRIRIGDSVYDVQADTGKMTVAQYVDFTEYFKKNADGRYLAEVLSTMLLPKGKKYNDGYELEDVIDDIRDNLDITTANSLMFFFRKTSVRSMKTMLFCLRVLMRMTKTPTEELKERMAEIEASLRRMQCMAGSF